MKKKLWRKVVSILGVITIGSGAMYYYLVLPNKPKAAEQTTFQYGPQSKQNLEVYKPSIKKGDQTPVILYVHGGSWMAGDKENVADKPKFFNDMGYTFISVNYRLAPKANYRDMGEDIAAALKWVKDYADEYQFDAEKITLMGHSAGGHLVTLIASDESYLEKENLELKDIHSIIEIEGPLNIPQFVQENKMYKTVFSRNKEKWKLASPSHYIQNKKMPLMLFITRPDESTTSFMNEVESAGNEVELFSASTLSHTDLTKLIGTTKQVEAQQLTGKVASFLKKYN